jgi:TonB family protein
MNDPRGELLQTVARLGEGLLAWIGPMTVATGALLLVAWLADRTLERRVAASLRLFLYAGVLARLALPVDWQNPLGLLGRASRGGGTVLGPDAAAITVGVGQAPFAGLGLAGWAAVGYALVVLALLARWSYLRIALGRRLRGCPAEPIALAEGVPVLRHEELGPFVAGLVRPRIVIPRALAEGADGEALAWVLRHEAAHVRRRDPLATALVQIACILAWPVLPVWIASRRIRTLMEVACDESAVRGRGGSARRRYGEVLLALAGAGSSARGLAATLRFGSPLRGRLRALAGWRRWPVPVQALVVAPLVMVLLACAGQPPSEAETDASIENGEKPILTVKSDGTLDLSGRQVTVNNLTEELRHELLRTGSDTLLLRGDKRVMMRQSVDIMGLAKRAGARNIGILTAERAAAPPTPGAGSPPTSSSVPPRPPTSSSGPTRGSGFGKRGTAASGSPEASGPLSGTATVRGSLDKNIIRSVIREHISEVRDCYERQLARRPELAGQVQVKFTIGSTGDVVSSVLGHSDLAAPPVESCVVAAVRGWMFPPPQGGGIVIVTYPFKFSPAAAAAPPPR